MFKNSQKTHFCSFPSDSVLFSLVSCQFSEVLIEFVCLDVMEEFIGYDSLDVRNPLAADVEQNGTL